MKLHLFIHPRDSLEKIIAACDNINKDNHSVVAIVINGADSQDLLDWNKGKHSIFHFGEGNYSRNARALVSIPTLDDAFKWIAEYKGINPIHEEGIVEQVIEEVVEKLADEEDELLHEHKDGTIHSHEGGDEDHEHEEDLEDEEVEDNDVSDGSDSGAGTNPWVWDRKSS